MPVWEPRGQHAERLRQAADAAAAAAANAAAPSSDATNDWMRRFGAPIPAAPPPATAAPTHDWTQNFAPGDFLPLLHNVEDHLRRLGLAANQPIITAPIIAPVATAPPLIMNVLPAALPLPTLAGHGSLSMFEFLTLYPHLGVRPNLVHPVGHLIHLHHVLLRPHTSLAHVQQSSN